MSEDLKPKDEAPQQQKPETMQLLCGVSGCSVRKRDLVWPLTAPDFAIGRCGSIYDFYSGKE